MMSDASTLPHVDCEQLSITGERTVPGIWHENYWFRRHEVVYERIAEQVGGRTVLEAGCGEGYGAHMLARRAASVHAVDYDRDATAHVRRAYPNVAVTQANLVALPFADASFDVVVSLQTVEHLWDQDAFLAECVRVARPGGVVIISTPNTLTFPPGNPYHPHELDPGELGDLAARYGQIESFDGVYHGEHLSVWEDRHGSIVDAQLADEPEAWPAHVRERVAGIVTSDFVIGPVTDDCADLIITLRTPAR